jgi:hypothetical protein
MSDCLSEIAAAVRNLVGLGHGVLHAPPQDLSDAEQELRDRLTQGALVRQGELANLSLAGADAQLQWPGVSDRVVLDGKGALHLDDLFDADKEGGK